MKKILAFLCLWTSVAFGQTFPVNNLTVAGTAAFTGLATFTLSPLAPTPTTGDSSTKLATTAFVGTAVANTVGLYAPLVSPAFTGIPTGPTASLGTSTTQLATTAFVAAHTPCLSILDFGGNNTDSANNDSAWTAVINAQSSSNQICVYFPKGFYAFSGQATYTFPNALTSIMIKGDGPEITNLYWPNSSGIIINSSSIQGQNSTHVRDMTLLTGHAGSNTGLFFNNQGTSGGPSPQVQSDVTNVELRGADGFSQTDYWGFAFSVTSWSQVNVSGMYVSGGGNFSGIGIALASANPPNGIVYNISNSTFNFVGTGISYGNNIQGVTVHQCNFDTNIGISVPGGESGLDQLVVTASQFGINSGANSGINVQSNVANIQLIGNLFIVPGNSTGVVLNNTSIFSLVGNSFNEGAGATTINGLSVANTTGPGVVTGNIFDGMVGGSGIALFSTAHGVNVQSNVYSGNSTNVSNGGGAACPPTTSANCIGTSSTP